MSTRRFRSLLTGVAALSLWAVTLPSYAVTLTFTDSAAFFAGLPGAASTLDFDHLPLGTLIPSGTEKRTSVMSSARRIPYVRTCGVHKPEALFEAMAMRLCTLKGADTQDHARQTACTYALRCAHLPLHEPEAL